MNSSITGVAPQVGQRTRNRVFSQMRSTPRGTPQVEKEAMEADEMIKSRRGLTSHQNRIKPKNQFKIKRGKAGLSSQLDDLRQQLN